MARTFDEILDECLNRITLGGEAVEDCLGLYPEMAKELEPHLRIMSRAYRTSSFSVSPEAKERGRRRLQVERQALVREIAAVSPRRGWASPLGVFQRRWAVAVSSVLVVLFLGAGAVAASTTAVPGQALYPVKGAWEDVRLSLTFSDEGKAELHALYAQLRVNELAILARQGKADKVAALAREMEVQLQQVALLMGGKTKAAISGPPGPASPSPEGTAEAAPRAQDLRAPETTTATATAPQVTVPLPQGIAAPTATPSPTPTPAPAPPAPRISLDEPGKAGQEARVQEAKSPFQQALEEQARRDLEVLEKARDQAPAEARDAVEQAIEAARRGYAQAIAAAGR